MESNHARAVLENYNERKKSGGIGKRSSRCSANFWESSCPTIDNVFVCSARDWRSRTESGSLTSRKCERLGPHPRFGTRFTARCFSRVVINRVPNRGRAPRVIESNPGPQGDRNKARCFGAREPYLCAHHHGRSDETSGLRHARLNRGGGCHVH
jgi:hypothetical protein